MKRRTYRLLFRTKNGCVTCDRSPPPLCKYTSMEREIRNYRNGMRSSSSSGEDACARLSYSKILDCMQRTKVDPFPNSDRRQQRTITRTNIPILPFHFDIAVPTPAERNPGFEAKTVYHPSTDPPKITARYALKY